MTFILPERSTPGGHFIAQAQSYGGSPGSLYAYPIDLSQEGGKAWNGQDSQLWSFSLRQTEAVSAYLQSLLTPEEAARASRYKTPEARRQFYTGRGALRLILSLYTGIEPENLVLLTGPRGKPYLAPSAYPASSVQSLFFNLSHSSGQAILGVSPTGEVGVDLEAIHLLPEMDTLARQYFSPGERALLDTQAGRDKDETFFTIWTMKEALLKAWGTGLAYPVNTLTIRRVPHSPLITVIAESTPSQDSFLEASYWSPILQPPPNFCAAMVVIQYR